MAKLGKYLDVVYVVVLSGVVSGAHEALKSE